MPNRLYTEEELDTLRAMPKRIDNPGSRWSEKPVGAPSHRQRSFKAKARGRGGEPSLFEIYQRENIRDDTDFSCGIVHMALDGSRLTLARYNGSGHEHGDILYRPHIHRATEKAIASGRKPEREAEATDRYQTLEGALACLLEDFRIAGMRAEHDHPRLPL